MLPPPGGQTDKPLRIVIVSQYFPPEIGATQSRMQAFAEHLAARGHRVTVICEFPSHPHGVVPEAYRGRLVEDDRSNEYRVLRTWIKTNPHKTQATRLELYLSFMALATALAPRAGRADVVLATTPPLFAAAAGLAIARMNRAPFVLDVRDLWPAAASSLNQISSGPITRAAEWLERILYCSADRVVAVTRPFCDHVDALRGGRPPATELIPNGTFEFFFEPAQPEPRDARFRVTFAGTLGIAQALPSVIEAAERLDDDVQFQLVGEGPLKNALRRDVELRGVRNVVFREQLPLVRIPPVLAASDVLLVTLSGHTTFTSFVPSKLIDFMAVGKPVLLAASGESARVVEQAQAGLVVPPEDPAALAKAIGWLRAHPDEARQMGERGRAFARTRLRSRQAERLEHVVIDAVDRWRHR
jgi:glycosyltransferase involved in cell wall biosynthesis